MVNAKGLKAGVIATAFVAWPLLSSAQTTTGQAGTTQPPSQTQGASGQSQGAQAQIPANPTAEGRRQAVLSHLTAARQSLADMTKLPEATHRAAAQ